jgi:gamma-glutamylaminecyclotransferase
MAKGAAVSEEPTILFVYGTLKRGFANHHLMAPQQFIGEAVTRPRYRVLDLGPHPGLILDEANGLAVKGELWAVSAECLARLDEFEEVPGPFIRARVEIERWGEEVDAYFWNRAMPAGTKSGNEWPLASAERGTGNAE